MTDLNQTLKNLTHSGPIIDVKIEPPLGLQEVLRSTGQEIPSISLFGMIDTGASGTLIDSAAFQSLSIEPYAFVGLRTASTTQPLVRGKYRVRVVLAESMAFEVDAVEGSLIGQKVQCLIGRDILEELVFTYDGPQNSFSLTLP